MFITIRYLSLWIKSLRDSTQYLKNETCCYGKLFHTQANQSLEGYFLSKRVARLLPLKMDVEPGNSRVRPEVTVAADQPEPCAP